MDFCNTSRELFHSKSLNYTLQNSTKIQVRFILNSINIWLFTKRQMEVALWKIQLFCFLLPFSKHYHQPLYFGRGWQFLCNERPIPLRFCCSAKSDNYAICINHLFFGLCHFNIEVCLLLTAQAESKFVEKIILCLICSSFKSSL